MIMMQTVDNDASITDLVPIKKLEKLKKMMKMMDYRLQKQ